MILNSRNVGKGSRFRRERMRWMEVVFLSVVVSMLTFSGGCTIHAANVGNTMGTRTFVPGKPRVELWSEPDRWILIRNPRYLEDDPIQRREPPYVWAEKGNLPLTLNKLVGGEAMIIAPPEILEKFKGDKVRPK